MDILKGLNDAVGYIEENLDEEVDLERPAQIAGLSQDGFSRFFSYISGMTVKEYVRRRRLTLAAYELRETSVKVIDLAVKYGFRSSDAFARAFSKQHGFSPIQARETGRALQVYPPISFYIAIKGAVKMDFKLVDLKGMTLRGISRSCEGSAGERFQQECAMWSTGQDRTMERICKEGPGVWYGLWDHGRYWVAKPEEEAIQDGTDTVGVPAGTYAVFTTQRGGTAGDELPKLHKLIFESWLSDAGYRQTADFEMEIYHLYPLHPREEKLRRYYVLWIPVEKAPAHNPVKYLTNQQGPLRGVPVCCIIFL